MEGENKPEAKIPIEEYVIGYEDIFNERKEE